MNEAYRAKLEFYEIPRTTFQAKNIVKIGRFSKLADGKKLKQAKVGLMELMEYHKPKVTIPGPYRIEMKFYFSPPKARLKRVQKEGVIYRIVKPDLDNLVKGFTDAMAKTGWINGDEKVVEYDLAKYEKLNSEYVEICIHQLDTVII